MSIKWFLHGETETGRHICLPFLDETTAKRVLALCQDIDPKHKYWVDNQPRNTNDQD